MTPGQLVVCTDAGGSECIHVGGVYRLSETMFARYHDGTVVEGVRLQRDDVAAENSSATYPASMFRVLLACWHVPLREWCLSCSRWEYDEPGDFLACLECGHVFRTAAELVAAENNIRRQMGEAELVVTDDLREVVAQIHSCPHCTHDW